MSRSELVQRLARAGARGDRRTVQETVEMLISEARAQQQHSFADRLAEARTDRKAPEPPERLTERMPDAVKELILETRPNRRLKDLVLSAELRDDVCEFVYEFENAALLRASSLEPRHTVLLVGPPGNGKTSLAEAIASELGLPFLVVRYDAIIDSYLGETATRLRRIIEYATAVPCVLFFDEFDAIGKERGDSQETGEIKRVVSSLLVQMDSIPSHSVVVCATNHPELLDRAVWRRFEVRLQVDRPGTKELYDWYVRMIGSLGQNLGISPDEFIHSMLGESFSELEAFTLDVRRKVVLSRGHSSPAEVMRAVLRRWRTHKETDLSGGAYGGSSDHKNYAGAASRKKKARS